MDSPGLGSLVQPFQDFQSAHAWHSGIQQQQSREGINRSFLERWRAAEVINHFLAVADNEGRLPKTGIFNSSLQQQHIIGIVFCDQDNLPIARA